MSVSPAPRRGRAPTPLQALPPRFFCPAPPCTHTALLNQPPLCPPPPRTTTGQAQLDTTDVFSTSSYGLRRLSAYYARNFEAQRPQKCYSSSYFSPYRLYFLSQTFPEFSTARFSFQLDVSSCPVSKAMCCGERLDHLLIRTGARVLVRARLRSVCACRCVACMSGTCIRLL